MGMPDDPPTPNELYISELEFDRSDLLEELKRLADAINKAFEDPKHFCDDDGSYIDTSEIYTEFKSAQSLITKIEGKEDEKK